MKKIITIIIIIVVVITIIFIKINYKKLKNGNNMSKKSAEEIAEYILGISSYKTTEEIIVESNKNTNKYKVKEEYIKENNISKTEILEPDNLKGIIFTYDGANLKIENSNLGLNKIYENYQYIGENTINLASFIKEYQESEDVSVIEENEEVILKLKLKSGNKYIAYKTLYINKNEGKPIKLEIKDITQKILIYILYNEIEINNLQKEDTIAFKTQLNTNDI